METLGKRIANFFRPLAWYADYGLFLLINPFKFKKMPSTFKNILVVELLYIGDVIVTTPTVRALKQKFPDAKITMMLLPSMADLYTGNPNVDNIITFSKDDFKYKFQRIVDSIKGKYDLGIILHPGVEIGSYTISKLLYKAKIPFRIGCTKVGFLEGRGFFLHRKTKPTFEYKHKINDNLDVVKVLGVTTNDKHLELYTSPDADDYIFKLLKKNKIMPNDFVVVIQAAGKHKTHFWFDDRFAKVADTLIEKYNAKVVFSGAIEDFVVNSNIIKLMKHTAVNVAGLTDIKQLISLVNRANLVISVDTGTMHVAAALERPVVALFGAGDPRNWMPYSPLGNARFIYKWKDACVSCRKYECKRGDMQCMDAIKVEDVLAKVEDLLKR
ncbi:MAG: glycosyltransferase family 9 protein [Candidatus Nanoarchaeia archaeon]